MTCGCSGAPEARQSIVLLGPVPSFSLAHACAVLSLVVIFAVVIVVALPPFCVT